MSIFSFKRKIFPDWRLMKDKSSLCAHSGIQQRRVNYWETYAPVVNWILVCTFFLILSIHNLETCSINSVLTFPQAELDINIFIDIPMGMKVHGACRHVPKPNKSLYGLKQASANWFDHIKKGLKSKISGQNFTQSRVYPCVFYRRYWIILCYVDDWVLVSRDTKTIDFIVKYLIDGPENYLLIDKGMIQYHLGVDIKPGPNEGEF